MPVKRLSFETVRELAREFGEVSEGAQAIKAGGKLWAWVPPHTYLEPGTLAVRLDLDQRAALIEEAPEVYYVTNHYLKATAVLVRLEKIDRGALRDLLGASRKFVLTTEPSPKRPRANRPGKR
jgi:hypothetical protein